MFVYSAFVGAEPFLFAILSAIDISLIKKYTYWTEHILHYLFSPPKHIVPYIIYFLAIVLSSLSEISYLFQEPIPDEDDTPKDEEGDEVIPENDSPGDTQKSTGSFTGIVLLLAVFVCIGVFIPTIIRDIVLNRKPLYNYYFYGLSGILITCTLAYIIVMTLYYLNPSLIGITQRLDREYYTSTLISSFKFFLITLTFLGSIGILLAALTERIELPGFQKLKDIKNNT